MKKLYLLLLLCATVSAFSQGENIKGILLGPENQQISLSPTDEGCLLCTPQALFTNSPSLTAGFGLSDDQRCYTSYDNFYGLTEPIGKVVLWGTDLTYTFDYVPCTPVADKAFEIVFYGNNLGEVGAPVASFVVTPLKSFCLATQMNYGAPLYRYEFQLDSPVNLAEGWMSVRAIGGEDGCWFAWDLATEGDYLCWQDCDGWISSYNLDFAFCLYKTENQYSTIPVSNWALFIGIFLIGLFTAWRMVKKS